MILKLHIKFWNNAYLSNVNVMIQTLQHSVEQETISFFLARLNEVLKSYCSHPGRTRSRSRLRHTFF